MKETIADVSSASPSSERMLSPDEGLAFETSAIVSFTAFHYPHQHTVDTPVCLPPRRRSQPSSLKSWHYTVLHIGCSKSGYLYPVDRSQAHFIRWTAIYVMDNVFGSSNNQESRLGLATDCKLQSFYDVLL